MTLQESQKHQIRLIRQEDDEETSQERRSERRLERRFEKQSYAPEIKYVFRLRTRQKPPEVHTTNFRLWDIISTSDGPHKVVEIFWSGCEKRGWQADVLLKPVSDEAPKELRGEVPARHSKSRRQKSYQKSYNKGKRHE